MCLIKEVDNAELKQFVYFINERQSIFEKRLNGEDCPWTSDLILANNKFCNVFRVADRGSQLSIKTIEQMPTVLDEIVFAFAYRKTNSTRGWTEAIDKLGIPTHENISEWILETEKRNIGITNNCAYHICCGVPKGETIRTALANCIDRHLELGTFQKITEEASFEKQMDILLSIERIGKFTGQQILTDFTYGSTGYNGVENRGIVLGPGSIRGLKLLFPGKAPMTDMVKTLQEFIFDKTNLSLKIDNISIEPSLMDIQNCLCEYDKYCRVKYKKKNHTRIYKNPKEMYNVVLPKSWN